MIRAHDLPEPVIQIEAARQKALQTLEEKKHCRDGNAALRRIKAQQATVEALRAEADAGHVVIPRKLPLTDPASGAAAYQSVQDAADELMSWKQALAESLAGRIGAFSVGFCRKQIREISYAIARAKAAPLLDKIRL